MGEKHPGKFIANTRFDPRDGDAGLEELRRNVERYGSKGVKLYTAEWNNGSRGYKLTDPAAYRFLEAAQELGIKNIHVHKGPTIWPLDKDAFDVSDVDHAATDFPELNFIVEHVGLPRIEDFCFMATQEPNVYAGPVGRHRRPHARAAEVLRQGHGRAAVLGRRGQDDVRQRLRHLGAQVAGRGLRRLADCPTRGVLRLPEGDHRHQEEDPRPQRGQALRHQGARRVPAARSGRHARAAEEDAQLVTGVMTAGHGHAPSAERRAGGAGHACATRNSTSRSPRWGSSRPARCPVTGGAGSGCACPPTSAPPTSRSSWSPTPTTRSPRVPGVRSAEVILEDHFAGDAINAGVAAQAGFVASFDGEAVAELDELRAQFLRKAVMAGTDQVCRPLVAAGVTPAELLAMTLGEVPSSPELARLRRRRAELGLPAGDDAPLLIDPATGGRVEAGRACRCTCAAPA